MAEQQMKHGQRKDTRHLEPVSRIWHRRPLRPQAQPTRGR